MRTTFETQLRRVGLYGIIDRGALGRRSPVAVAKAMIAGGVRLIQYRAKKSGPADVYRACWQLRPVLKKARVLFIVNDYPDVALAVGADGVHVGPGDLPVAACRKVIGDTMILGRSSSSLDEALDAARGPIDYLAVGAIFPTITKHKDQIGGLELLRNVRAHVTLPLFAIGGITAKNLDQVLALRPDGVAMISDVLNAPDVARHVRALNARIHSALGKHT